MLAAKRSAGVTPEVILRIPLYLRLRSTQVRRFALALKPRAAITKSSKQGYQCPTRRIDVLQKFSKKKQNKTNLLISSGSSGRVRGGGQETWNLCGRLRWPSFLWPIFTGPGGGPWPPQPPPWIRYCASTLSRPFMSLFWSRGDVSSWTFWTFFEQITRLWGWLNSHFWVPHISWRQR